MKENISRILAFILIGMSCCVWSARVYSEDAAQPSIEQKMKEAESAYQEKSWAQAAQLYGQISPEGLPAEQARWLAFRQDGSKLMNLLSSNTYRNKEIEMLFSKIEKGVTPAPYSSQQKDALWAEGMEFLGDACVKRDKTEHIGRKSLEYYQQALDYWAGSTELEQAQECYLEIVWKCVTYRGGQMAPTFSYGKLNLPQTLLQNAIKIARDREEESRMHILLANAYQNRREGGPSVHFLIEREYQKVLQSEEKSPWYDLALIQYGQWVEDQGKVVWLSEGNYRFEPDYEKALASYQKILDLYKKEETPYYDAAQEGIKRITTPLLVTYVSEFFLPGSSISFSLQYRNIDQLNLALYPLNLVTDIPETDEPLKDSTFLDKVNLTGKTPVYQDVITSSAPGSHREISTNIVLKSDLSMGAYLLEASGEKQSSRGLVLVSDMGIIFKNSPQGENSVYVCNVLSGEPIANAEVCLRTRTQVEDHWKSESVSAKSDASGLARLKIPASQDVKNFNGLLCALKGSQQALLFPWFRPTPPSQEERLSFYVFTDRPIYRPQEKVEWKAIVRSYVTNQMSTPAGAEYRYQIQDPKHQQVQEGTLQLNDFGSGAGSLLLTPQMTLGEYTIQFYNTNSTHSIAQATLFRLEEYKLPEYKVRVLTDAGAGAEPQTYRLGNTITATIEAEYFFGGPLANATVQVEVFRKNYYHSWKRESDYPWLYNQRDRRNNWSLEDYQGGSVKSETLKTDAQGQVKVTFDTPLESRSDLEYTILARVSDASRSEVTAKGSVKVTGQSYYVQLKTQKNIFTPGEKATLQIQAQDANTHPQKVEGRVNVKRKFWVEKWISPANKLVEGEELEKWKISVGKGNFPPPQEPGKKPWRLSFIGYQFEEILSQKVQTTEEGKAELQFPIQSPGCYTAQWSGDDFILQANGEKIPWRPVKTETVLWAADQNTKTIHVRNQGLQMILNQDTARLGSTLPLLIQSELASRYVLFTVEADTLIQTQVVKMNGDTKLIEVPITDIYSPNVWFSLTSLSEGEVFQNDAQVIVPPEKNSITVQVSPSAPIQEPRQSGKIQIRTLDYAGQPLSAEVALGVTDESLYSIQEEYALAPMEFFYGQTRERRVNTSHSLWRPLARNIIQEEGEEEFLSEDLAEMQSLQPELAQASVTQNSPLRAYKVARGRAASGGIEMMESAMADSAMASGMGGEAMLSESQVYVRNDFRSTLLWEPFLRTNEEGKAEIEVTYPDNLTSWRISARAHTRGNEFGAQKSEVKTQQPLMARLQAPRFFTVGDQLTLSCLLNNNSTQELSALTRLKIEPAGLLEIKSTQEVSVAVPAGGEKRVDWQVVVLQPGEAQIQVMARSQSYADAMEKSYPVYEHGIEKQVSRSGKLSPEEVQVSIDLPQERRTTAMEISLSSSLATTLLDALPYLFDYPYECTEQTVSRFLPAVVLTHTLIELGAKPEDIEARLFGADKAQGTPDATAPEPLSKLKAITQKSLERLYKLQHEDGSWSWWQEVAPDPRMSAYVVCAMAMSKSIGIEIEETSYQKATQWLNENLLKYNDSFEGQLCMLYALSCTGQNLDKKSSLSVFQNIYEKRDQLYSGPLSLLALTAKNLGLQDEVQVLGRNLENGVLRDDSPDESLLFKQSGSAQSGGEDLRSAHWSQGGILGRWGRIEVEPTALGLAALLSTQPQSELIDPVVNWLIKNRRSTHWNNTWDTALSILALCDFLKKGSEDHLDVEYALEVNGNPVDSRKLELGQLLSTQCKLWVDPALLHTGKNVIKIQRIAGKAPLYFSISARYFSLEEPILATGNEIFVRRQYYKLDKIPTLLQGPALRKTLLKPGDPIQSSDRIECVLTLESKSLNDYLLFEDFKPAGFESTLLKSGGFFFARELDVQEMQAQEESLLESENEKSAAAATPALWIDRSKAPAGTPAYTGRSTYVYQEQRDRKIAFFIESLDPGVWELRSEYRVETPGTFHALPVLGEAMYVPEIRCNSDEFLITIEEPSEK